MDAIDEVAGSEYKSRSDWVREALVRQLQFYGKLSAVTPGTAKED